MNIRPVTRERQCCLSFAILVPITFFSLLLAGTAMEREAKDFGNVGLFWLLHNIEILNGIQLKFTRGLMVRKYETAVASCA